MQYEKARAEMVSFEDLSFMTFSGQELIEVLNAIHDQVGTSCSDYGVSSDGESFYCGGYQANKKDPVHINVGGQVYTYYWSSNAGGHANYKH